METLVTEKIISSSLVGRHQRKVTLVLLHRHGESHSVLYDLHCHYELSELLRGISQQCRGGGLLWTGNNIWNKKINDYCEKWPDVVWSVTCKIIIDTGVYIYWVCWESCLPSLVAVTSESISLSTSCHHYTPIRLYCSSQWSIGGMTDTRTQNPHHTQP